MTVKVNGFDLEERGDNGRTTVNHLISFGARFIKLGRLVIPAASTQILIGKVCQKLQLSGKLDPSYPRIYNDVSIALLARQIGATVVTRNISDFEKIHKVVDFRFRDVSV